MEYEPLLLHQCTRRAVVSVSLDIIIFLLCRRAFKRDLLHYGIRVIHRRDFPVLLHVGENPVPSCDRVIHICHRIIECRIVRNRAQKRNLRQAEFLRAPVEIPAARRLNSIVAISEIYIIQIKFQDLILRVLLLHAARNENLFDLSLPCPLLRNKHIARKLHRNRTAALRNLPVLHHRFYSAQQRPVVHPVMTIELLILNADNRRLCIRRNVIALKIVGIPAFLERRDHAPVRRIDNARLMSPECIRRRIFHKPLRLGL